MLFCQLYWYKTLKAGKRNFDRLERKHTSRRNLKNCQNECDISTESERESLGSSFKTLRLHTITTTWKYAVGVKVKLFKYLNFTTRRKWVKFLSLRPSLSPRKDPYVPRGPNDGAEWLALLAYIWEVPGSYIGPKTVCPDWDFSWFFWEPPGKCRYGALN
jgi:hypothetical protein